MRSPVAPQQKKAFNSRLRAATRPTIFNILQGRLPSSSSSSSDARKLAFFTKFLESKLMSLAKTEEEYSDLLTLQPRIDCILRERLRISSKRHLTKRDLHAISADRVSPSGCDTISQLPDCLITQILSYLPTKDSVKTSVLSKRWRFLWCYVPGMELCSTDFPSYIICDMMEFIDRFLEFNSESRLQKFKVKYNQSVLFGCAISKPVAIVISRGVEHLEVDTPRISDVREFMPLDIYMSKTLVSLKLVNVEMCNPGFVVSLPCLKIMHLEDIVYETSNSSNDPSIMEKLISGCHVLEDLTVVRNVNDNAPVLRVRSQTLKRIRVKSGPGRVLDGTEYAVEIDAPALKYMNFGDNQSDKVVAKNLSSLQVIDIDTKFNIQIDTPWVTKKSSLRGFLIGISNVRHMIISQPTLEVLYRCFKLGSVSRFHNLSRLEASFCTLLLQVLPNFLASFPNLKHLTLYLVYLKDLEPENLQLTGVPWCLRSTLETVEIREVITQEETTTGKNNILEHKKKIWMEAVRYILENSTVLKKLILCFSPTTNQVTDVFKELHKITKRSPKCEIYNQFI